MKAKNIIINLLLMSLVSATSMFIYHKNIKQQTAYIDIKKVFNNFQMKKELEEKFKKTQKGRHKILDSLSFNLHILSKHLNEQKANNKTIDENIVQQFGFKREEYLKFKTRIEEDNAALSQKYDQQILEQMTQYIIEYGKKHNYDFIYGADGSGTLMYSNNRFNLSDEICIYINNKYKGVE